MDLSAFTKTDCQGVLIANPNSPTGIGIPRTEMEAFVKANLGKIVIVDEAYMGFLRRKRGEPCSAYGKI